MRIIVVLLTTLLSVELSYAHYQLKVDYPKERTTRESLYNREQKDVTHSYMYINPFYRDYYSNYYDNDGTQFYFFFRRDDPTYESDDIPQNYNNQEDYSVTNRPDETE